MHMSSAFREDLESAMSFPALFFILSVPWGFHSCSSRALRLDTLSSPPAPESSAHHGISVPASSWAARKLSLCHWAIQSITAGPISQTGSRTQEAGRQVQTPHWLCSKLTFLPYKALCGLKWLDGGHGAQRVAGVGRTSGGKDIANRGGPRPGVRRW